jgi:hypothetical protein
MQRPILGKKRKLGRPLDSHRAISSGKSKERHRVPGRQTKERRPIRKLLTAKRHEGGERDIPSIGGSSWRPASSWAKPLITPFYDGRCRHHHQNSHVRGNQSDVLTFALDRLPDVTMPLGLAKSAAITAQAAPRGCVRSACCAEGRRGQREGVCERHHAIARQNAACGISSSMRLTPQRRRGKRPPVLISVPYRVQCINELFLCAPAALEQRGMTIFEPDN